MYKRSFLIMGALLLSTQAYAWHHHSHCSGHHTTTPRTFTCDLSAGNSACTTPNDLIAPDWNGHFWDSCYDREIAVSFNGVDLGVDGATCYIYSVSSEQTKVTYNNDQRTLSGNHTYTDSTGVWRIDHVNHDFAFFAALANDRARRSEVKLHCQR